MILTKGVAMISIYTVVVAAACGVAAGALVVSALHARTSAVPAFFVGNIEQVSDEALLAKYRAVVAKTESDYGGYAVARGRPVMLDSSPLPTGSVVILQFPSMKALMDWWNSPAYAAVRLMREQASVGRIYALEGLPLPARRRPSAPSSLA